jgi:hypothetical protein
VSDVLETIGFRKSILEIRTSAQSGKSTSPIKNFPVYDHTRKKMIDTGDVTAGDRILVFIRFRVYQLNNQDRACSSN